MFIKITNSILYGGFIKVNSEKTKVQKCAESQKGRIVIHKGDQEKRIYSYELDKYINDGWLKGISDKHKKSNSDMHKGKDAWNKGKPRTWKSPGDFKKGQDPWNKGLTQKEDARLVRCGDGQRNKPGHRLGQHNSEEHNRKISIANKGKIPKKLTEEQLRIKLSKQYLTHKKNNSFNKSKPEEDLYESLLKENVNKTIYRQYKDPVRYPYYCDFYILEDDLFIELNAHWTHGGRPYDPEDEFCKNQLAAWKEKAKTSQFYANAIDIWTVKDVQKLKCAQEHNLNYKTIY